MGTAICDFRDEVAVATKMGVHHDANNNLVLDSHPETIRKSCEKSLRKLGVDCIDLYYQHRIDPKVEPEVVAKEKGCTMGQLSMARPKRSGTASTTSCSSAMSTTR